MYQFATIEAGDGGTGPRGFATAAPRAPAFGKAKRRDPNWLTVDLKSDLFSGRWWRGAATLSVLLSGVAMLTPPPAALAATGKRIDLEQGESLGALGVAPATMGGTSGGGMASTDAVEPLTQVPERRSVELKARLGSGDRVGMLLMRLGAAAADAVRVDAMVLAAAPSGVEAGTPIAIRLGEKDATGRRPVETVELRATLDTMLKVSRDGGALSAVRTAIPVDTRPLRIRGRVGDGLYWSLRSAGVNPATAGDYLRALSTQIDVAADLTPDARFDLIIANRRAATGENQPGNLLYAGIERPGAKAVQLLKWNFQGRTDWYEADSLTQVSGGSMQWPVAAPITSGFGMRYHPILHFSRMHKGIDFGAHWGAPITAAADGQVTQAGWAGGYGQQVRIAHGDGFASSYSHMSRMVVSPGSTVRQGQLIGYVGSTGLSTGPHLHFETYQNGVAVNPRTVNFGVARVDNSQLVAFRARLKALLASSRRG